VQSNSKIYPDPQLQSREKCIVSVLLLFLLTSLYAHGQQATGKDLQELNKQAREQAQSYIDDIRPKLFADLPPNEKQIYDRIKFRLTEDNAAWETGGSVNDHGDRFISLDVGYVRKIEMLAEAVRLEGSTKHEVLIPYIGYVARSLNERKTYIKSPASFIGMSMSEIDKLDEPSPEKRQMIAMIANSIAFVLAHEVGHHVLGHYEHPAEGDMERSRQMESEADAWALKRCVKAHVSPLGGMLPIIFDYYTTAYPVKSERKNDHPADVRRLRAMYTAMLDSLPGFRAEIEAQGVSYSAFRAAAKRQLDEYDWQLTSGHSVAYDDSMSPFEACMQRRVWGCMRDCIDHYDYSVAECGNRLCNPDSNTNWAERCRRLAK
jgi:hypothetical protein